MAGTCSRYSDLCTLPDGITVKCNSAIAIAIAIAKLNALLRGMFMSINRSGIIHSRDLLRSTVANILEYSKCACV